nr:S-layer homology domain-containing protein [uncultured Oscillibacter sp.]
MRKRILILLPLCVLAAAVWAAAAGDAADPLASLSYLSGVFTNKVDAAVDAAVDARLDSAGELPKENGGAPASVAVWTERRMKRDDILQAVTGDGVLLLAGSGQVSYSSGAVVDVTGGTVLPSGGTLAARHRYLVAEDTAANFVVTSKTAVVDWQGACTFHDSTSTDYNAMAAALKAMHLFQGSYTGYGQGFDLEAAPTRLQALIMFIRVLGEENEALAWNGTCPFHDVQPGTNGAKYVGYAYEKGYTNGYSATEFRPSSPVNARQYTEFILRALGYSSAANTDLSDALARAQSASLLTEGETAMLQRDPFLRAELVYISYYALEVPVAGTGLTLAQRLMDKGVFTQFERDSAPPVLNWRL